MFNYLHLIKAIITITHATDVTHIKQRMLKAIPWINHLATGMIANIATKLLSGEFLTNNTRVIVREIVLKNGYKHDEITIVMVEFLKFSGEDVIPEMKQSGLGKWVPILYRELRCDCVSCYLNLNPLSFQKAASNNCFQLDTCK